MGLDFTSKKASAPPRVYWAVGYLGRTVQGKGIGTLAERYGWNAAFYGILVSTLLGFCCFCGLEPETRGCRNPAAGMLHDTAVTLW